MKIKINKIENEQRKNTAKSSILRKLIKSINPYQNYLKEKAKNKLISEVKKGQQYRSYKIKIKNKVLKKNILFADDSSIYKTYTQKSRDILLGY